ncbi:uncharacterized protein AB675_7372 [Cyphellophora attinorum]|uniref:Choloylglycine hydrolase/NAAA C-terminal domain-containing protein n=1 Tax=Cyphellophora attinorum TaxID=1664694 RepID=A0A0N0NJ73_9EURO|nr:uncharacterized protein AB675_7372 [Phialophora attinorum]KPI36279.1 hypothetical protein AB675_7372 [Phialophora attinorum]
MLVRTTVASGLLLLSGAAEACSRVTYHAKVDDRITNGRSMDFVASTNSSIFVFPAGLNKNGSVADNPLKWTSKYGSMIVTMYDKVSIDGMNTEGLTGSLLYLGASDYGARNTSRPGLAIGYWLQYYLDQFATVSEAVADLNKTNLQVVTAALVPGVSSTGHISLSDKSGDNAVFEYLDGALVVHHGKQYQVMTNDPSYDDQLALDRYWEPISNVSLPGTSSPADRYVRLSYYNRLSPDSADLAGVDVWPTLWRTYQDPHDMAFFYESAVMPISVYMFYSDFNFKKGAEVMNLPLREYNWELLQGNMKSNFTKAEPFTPIGGNL